MDILNKNIMPEVEYPTIKGNKTVYIDKITVDEKSCEILKTNTPRELYIFGASVKTGEVHFKFGELSRIEFAVVEKNLKTNTQTTHFLAQYNYSIMYKREQDNTTYECVDMLKKKDIKFLNLKPRWKASEASIPKINNDLFYFAKQTFIPRNKITETYLTFEETFFTFLYVTEQDELIVQIFTQDTSAQTAEDHYKLEELIAKYREISNKPVEIEKLIKQGDKYFHEFVLETKPLKKETIESLIKFGKTKAIVSEAQKLLKNQD